ncbi:MAG: glycosyltransferase [Chloroflexota bacterium]
MLEMTMTIPEQLIKNAKTRFDLTEASHQASLYALTETLLDLPGLTLDELNDAAMAEDTPLEFKLAAKLVESRRFMIANTKTMKVGVIFAMWGEQNRLYPKSSDNPNGEDSLRVKLEQLAWITADSPIEWTLYAVDDGCPYDSGKIAQTIADDHPLGDKVRVLFLEQAVPTDSGPLDRLASANDSRKGGAIIYGAWQALQDGVDAIMYTDADNSVHLGQLGLLLQPHLEEGYRVIIGNRQDPRSVLVKQAARWGIGIKVLRHMQRMVGEAIFSRGIKDTQAAFKLYQRDMLAKILERPSVYDFSFDTDWLLAVIANEEPYKPVPFAFIDSAAESASIVQGPMTTWETLLKGLVTAVRAHNVPHNAEMARVLDEEIHSHKDLELLIHHLPSELEDAGQTDFGNPEVMSPAAMQAWIQQRKREEVSQ